MATSKPSVLTSSKTAQLRYLFGQIADGYFYSGQPASAAQEATFLSLVNDPEVDPHAAAEMQVKWSSHRRHRLVAPAGQEKVIELALNAALKRYADAVPVA
jgi:hypothetical protein